MISLHLLGRPFPHAKFLHLIRDWRNGAVSGWFHNFQLKKQWAETECRDLASFAEYYAKTWVRSISAGQEFGAEFSENYHEIRYEDLLPDGETELRDILNILGARRTRKK